MKIVAFFIVGFHAANQGNAHAGQTAMHHAFSAIPDVLWIITGVVLFFYQIDKKSYEQIVADLSSK